MSTYGIEKAWEEIRIIDLIIAAEAMLGSVVDVSESPVENGEKGKVTIRFTRTPNYMDDPEKYFRMLRSWTTLLEKIVPGKRLTAAHFRHDLSEFEANVIYRLPMAGAKRVGMDPRSFMRSMALFEVAFILSQALGDGSYATKLLKKYPDPRHKWESAIRSRIKFLDNAARIYVPKRPEYVPLQNRSYFE